ncbi:MAG: hypothetical protein HY680_01515, partial [Chloroflexi bacterium]|nr:hypothetical protein [Chloroflexota bacterium]
PFNMTPLSEVKFTGLEGTGIGGTDISLTELSLGGLLTGNAKVAGFSANRGLQDERVLVRVDVPGTRLYVAVVGANGAYSAKPYTLLVEASMPLDTAVLEAGLAAGTCSGSPLVAPSTQAVEVLQANASPLTLFVTQRERLQALYGLDNAAWSDLQDALVRLAGHDLVRGKIIFLPSGLYDGWDSNPCSIDAVNGLTASIQAEVQSQLSANPTIKYVVIVGSDDVVPYRRVPDETVISNERYYLIGSFLRPGSPLYTSVRQGYNLTDDYYVDRNPSPWQGRLLYLPDVPIGRLVETPQEIRNTAEAFLGSDGLLRRSSAFISGYDFFTDGAAAMADALASQLATQRLINDTWSAEDLRCELLGQSPCDSPADVNGINAHFTHYAALSAGGFNSANGLGLNDFLTSKEVALASGVPTALLGRIVFTMGCHAGLNVPDRSSASADPGLGIDPALDFPQAMAIQRAIYLASTGYGLGDDEGIGGTERLLVLFAKKLLQNDLPVGDALVLAKALYLGSLSAMTTYDEKSSIQTTLYGLPMYTVEAGSAPPPEPPPPGGGASLTLTVDGVQTAHTFAQVITANGSYYTADGDAQSTAGRPIEPRVAVPLPSNGSGPVHGVLLTASAFTDALGVDPVIARPTIEWEQNPLEPQACLPSFWPSDLASINSLETAGGLAQTLVVVPGQFRCTSGASPTVTGVQRLYTALTFALLRSTVEDFQPPTVSSVDLRAVNETTVALTVNASDPGGIAQVIVLRISTGDVVPVTLTLSSPLPTSGQFTLELTNLGQGEALVVQVVDGAGNVASATGKGANLSAIRVDAGIDQAFAAGIPTTLRSTVYGFEGLTAPVSFLWDFGDGSFAGGVLEATHPAIQEFTVAGGDLTFAVSHQYSVSGGPPFTATLKVTDANGGVGLDDVLVVLCSDSIGNGSGATRPDSDLAACSVATTATTMTVTVLVAGPITDLLGTDDQEDVQYRVRLDIGTYSVDPLTGARTLVSKMPDGLYDVQLRYLRGQVTGLSSLVVTPVIQDNVVVGLAFTVDLADIGRASGDHVYPIQWSSETQVGLKATSEVGISDNMPDSGLFGYVLE